MRKTSLLKKLIQDDEILVMPVAHDATAAKLIELTGFKAVSLGGYPTTATLLGKPDLSLATLTEMCTHAKNIAGAVDIPLFADGDTGHGGIINVMRTVSEFERAGAAGMFIEDQLFPKRCGHMEGKEVIETSEMIAKIKAAVDARVDPDFVIAARTDALAVTGIEDAIERANRYREAGADLIYVEAPTTKEEMIRINREVNAPTLAVQIEGGKTPLLPTNELQEIGYNAVAYPLSTLYAAAFAVRNVLEELMHKGTTSGCMDKMIHFNEFNQLMELASLREKESSYSKI
ncbi:isocitrate lyase/PEP mutase family protein [Desulfoscipio gibsoniae]|uniref:PEP phosphonomutase-like enzyme n=1 Tax=Desulfoscipio gibsoniae DSM 7213 TaxID=767817 RepID=R4KR13_9FIRM|nr:oxaloacetate decarboxylase [Desulfoscipio gibsoniae]AGL02051.1 PEP phosphonomutase-like enzyme [Desulfoscipio gibsoniae DSM 7213]